MRKLRSKGFVGALVALGLALAGAAAPVQAIPIVGDRTSVDVTSIDLLTTAGITLSGLGSTTILSAPGLLFAVFPVTGGDVDLPNSFAGTVEHEGSGLRLTIFGVDIDLTNFVLSTIAATLVADVAVNGTGVGPVSFFDVVACASGPPGSCQTLPNGAVIPTGFGLRISADAATLLGLPDLAGFQFGVANTALRAVPEPGSALLLGSALLALAAGRRHRTA